MNWSQEDNRHYRGPIDRIYVAGSEPWEVHYFIDHFLKTHNYNVNDTGRRVVGRMMEAYPGMAPVRRDELTAWLEPRIVPAG